jgi:hypothetical protein
MKSIRIVASVVLVFLCCAPPSMAWSPLAVEDDPLVRMPGTQPDLTGSIPFVGPGDKGNTFDCVNCHWGDLERDTDKGVPGVFWQGSMMGQAARDPIFWATMTVAAQDSIWAVGRPNATDICLRCHMPEGWLSGRSSSNTDKADLTNALNGGAMTGSDMDGVHCDICHRMYDPF